ncbi:MAG: TIGR03013 family PEP-CTERM/XrtA system glycosyltransferase [Nitrospirae bacterium]|nr:MAG: TIGR03013 family PEP-CTERM/XrtA system glycosyltransferase [Nitrospirota bacterium]
MTVGVRSTPETVEHQTAPSFFNRVLETLDTRKRVLIVGDSPLASDLIRVLVSKRRHRYDVIGVLSKDTFRVGQTVVGRPVVGTLDHLFETVERYRISVIAICLADRRGTLPLDALLDFKSMGIEVIDGHQLYESECGRLSIDELKPSALIFSSGFRRRPITLALKRLEDLIGATMGLVLLSPLMLLVSLLIKLDSHGPILYKQTRIGYRGAPYILWKFRSMYHNAEGETAQWASLGDSRVTRVGRWLRLLRIDELPQLVNVLKGEMSLVGPRPERPSFVQELRKKIPYYDLRHTIRPGLTGWAQICFNYAASVEDSHIKLQYDLYYVKHLSLWFDLIILLKTVRVVLMGEGAR